MTTLVQKLSLPTQLRSSDGSLVDSASALADKAIVGLYFSAHWCPPCRRFTPVLGEKYTALKTAGKSIELVFISSDRDETAFNEYHDSMPFLALPYSERKLKENLSTEFKVQGIPTLVLLDGKTGDLITTKGRSAFSNDVISEYPFDSYRPLFGKDDSVLKKLGNTLKGKSGNLDTASALSDKDVVGLYFSAHWCPPCRGFTPVLGEKYNELKTAGKSFEIVFVSSDRDESAFNEYHNSMPWLALPYSERQRKEQLSDLYGVQGIPSLVILDGKTGEIINKSARGALSSDTVVADFPFYPKPVNDLSVSLEGINDEPALIVFMEKASKDTQQALSTSLTEIAVAEKKRPKADQRVKLFFTGCGGGPLSQIRSGCDLGDATAKPQMLILDLDSRGAFYQPDSSHAAVTESNIQSFMDAFKAGTLTRLQWS